MKCLILIGILLVPFNLFNSSSKKLKELSDFSELIKHVLPHEAGYVNDPVDRGGETNFGISKKQYPYLDIKNLTLDDAINIYKRDYWDANRVDRLPNQYRLIYLDMVINFGPSGASKVIQKAINSVGGNLKVDGKIGPFTRRQLERYTPTIDTIRYQRILRYHDIVLKRPNQIKYLKGWISRAREI